VLDDPVLALADQEIHHQGAKQPSAVLSGER
jgi:hypothetical protein